MNGLQKTLIGLGILLFPAGMMIAISAASRSSRGEAERHGPRVALSVAGVAEVDRILGPTDNCAECHIKETEAWEVSTHQTAYKTRHRSKEAKAIMKKLGMRSMKRSERCVECHYTPARRRDRIQASCGVSCESCHGGGKDFIEIHNRRGGMAKGRSLRWGQSKKESDDERAVRLNAARNQGLIHTAMTYDLARRCTSCHVIDDEELVNEGGHSMGERFELLSWSQGEVRHSYARSEGSPSAPTNRAATLERKRLLYVVGALVNWEADLRRWAEVEDPKGPYGLAVLGSVRASQEEVRRISKVVDVAELREILEAVTQRIEEPGATTEDLALRVAELSRNLARTGTLEKLAGLDALLPAELRGSVPD